MVTDYDRQARDHHWHPEALSTSICAQATSCLTLASAQEWPRRRSPKQVCRFSALTLPQKCCSTGDPNHYQRRSIAAEIEQLVSLLPLP